MSDEPDLTPDVLRAALATARETAKTAPGATYWDVFDRAFELFLDDYFRFTAPSDGLREGPADPGGLHCGDCGHYIHRPGPCQYIESPRSNPKPCYCAALTPEATAPGAATPTDDPGEPTDAEKRAWRAGAEFAMPVAAPSGGLRRQLRLQVDAWRELQKQTTGQKEADEGYAVGLGHAIFVVEELLADATLATTGQRGYTLPCPYKDCDYTVTADTLDAVTLGLFAAHAAEFHGSSAQPEDQS
jgi:hypothetical protein